jgi:polar amino acid transport system ATP-binding protein
MTRTVIGTPLVRARNVTKSYGSVEVLRDFDIDIFTGEIAVLVGPSGSGKSTFLRAVAQLDGIDGGAIVVGDELLGFEQRDDHLVRRTPADVVRQRRKVGMVFQQFNLFPHKTALGNVIHAPLKVRKLGKAAATELGLRLLDQVGLADRATHYPTELSGGQQQRVAIARALAMEPELLLLDEPTSSLDPELVDEVLNVVRDLARGGQTMLIVTHEMSFARDVADRIVFMSEGRVLADGPSAQVFADPNPRLRSFFASQVQ